MTQAVRHRVSPGLGQPGHERQRPPLPLTTRPALSRAMALRLARDPWSAEAITDRLLAFLPVPFHGLAADLASALMAACPSRTAPRAASLARVLTDWPGLDRLYQHCLKHRTWPDAYLTSPRFCPVPAFDGLHIPALSNPADLAGWLMLPDEDLARFADRHHLRPDHEEMPVNHYFTRLVAKTGGGHRLIEAPKPRLKALQRQVLRGILAHVPLHPDAFAFVPGRDCRDAAARHAGEAMVIRFDLTDFFNHIQGPRVFGLFRSLGYPEQVADLLCALCTTVTPARIRHRLPVHRRQVLRTPHLPQGAPTSPALSNLICFHLDQRLSGLARHLDVQYSRYADDLTFSGDRTAQNLLLKAVPEIIKDEGFRINTGKTRVMRASQRQQVTGIVVNSHLNVPRRRFDRIKAIIHAGHWRTDRVLANRLAGQIGWVCQVNPSKGAKLLALLERAGGQASQIL